MATMVSCLAAASRKTKLSHHLKGGFTLQKGIMTLNEFWTVGQAENLPLIVKYSMCLIFVYSAFHFDFWMSFWWKTKPPPYFPDVCKLFPQILHDGLLYSLWRPRHVFT